jgi:hypothetical protein
MSPYRAPWFNGSFRTEMGNRLRGNGVDLWAKIHGTERGKWTWLVWTWLFAADEVCGDEVPFPAAARHACPKVGAA